MEKFFFFSYKTIKTSFQMFLHDDNQLARKQKKKLDFYYLGDTGGEEKGKGWEGSWYVSMSFALISHLFKKIFFLKNNKTKKEEKSGKLYDKIK